MADDAILEREPGVAQDAPIELAAVVHDDDDPTARAKRLGRSLEHARNSFAIAAHAAPDLGVVPTLEPEELEGVHMLLVVVDQARIRRRGQHEIDLFRRIEHPGVAVEDERRRLRPQLCELVDALGRVAHVAAQELRRFADGSACLPVLVAEVLQPHGLPREVEIVVSRAPGRARCP